jgi:hypothetical protein
MLERAIGKMEFFNSNMCFLLLAIGSVGVLSLPGSGDTQSQYFLDETSERLPVREDRSRDGAFGDLKGDGILDIIVSTPDISLYYPYHILNNGYGFFPEDSLKDFFAVSYNFPAVTIGDIERDNDLDVVFIANSDHIKLLVNEGDDFIDESETRLPVQSGSWSARDGNLVDIDGDVLLDIVFVQYGTGRIWLNEGDGSFDFTQLEQFPTGFQYSNAITWGDVDGDLDVDCVIANNTGYANMLMINDGTGWFSDETEVRLPIDTSPTNGITMVDADSDKDLDIVVGNGTPPGYNQIWINDGRGHFTDESNERLPYVWDTTLDVTSGDIDNDGDFDLLIANNGLNDRFNRILVNDGEGYFTDETDQRFPFVEEQTLTMIPGDVDSDGDIDCLIVNFGESSDPFSGQNRLLINNSTQDSFPPVIPSTCHHPDTGDTTNPYLITSMVWDNISVVIGELKTSLFYKLVDDTTRCINNSEFQEIPMLDCGGFLYRERIPAQSSDTIVEYYIKAEDRIGNVSYDPPNAPDSVFSFLVDAALRVEEDPSPSLPRSFSLCQNYPNPFNPSTTINYSVPEGETVQIHLSIYNLRGQLIRILVNEEQHPGLHSVHWDGMDGRGIGVASGTYIYQLIAGDIAFCKKMVLIR